MRALIDRSLTALARLALRGFYRRVEVVGAEHVPRDVPLLVVANHFNALLDAVLVMHALGRLPRFVAKAALWRPVWARPLLWLAGMVPVQRRQDGGDTAANHGMFTSTAQELAAGRTVALFPEGGLSPDPRLRPLRTGAARIALGARRAGTEGLMILPVGLVYEDTIALRSRALVRIGAPVDLDAEVARSDRDDDTTAPATDIRREVDPALAGDPNPEDPTAVRALTDLLELRLRSLAPAYRDELEAAALGRAADLAQQPTEQLPPPEVPLAGQQELARRLAEAPEAERAALIDHVARYELGLSLVGLRDPELVAGLRLGRLAGLLLTTVAKLALLAPFALVGAAINAVSYWGVHWSGRFVANPALRASARLLAGLVLFPPAWFLVAWLAPWDQWWARAAIIAAAPALGLVAVRALEEVVAVRRTWRGLIARIERRGTLDRLHEQRRALVARTERVAALVDAAGTTTARPQDGQPVPLRRRDPQ